MLLKGPDAASQAAEIILKHLGCGNVRSAGCLVVREAGLSVSGVHCTILAPSFGKAVIKPSSFPMFVSRSITVTSWHDCGNRGCHCPVVACSIIASTSRPDLFIRLSGQGMFPARTYHRSQILLNGDSCAAGLFRTGKGEPPAVLYRSVKTADEAANLLPKVRHSYHVAH